MSFSKRLKYLREQQNLTQKQVAESVGMAQMAYQRYEYGTREPAYKNLIALADYFDVSLDYLVGRSNNPKINKWKEIYYADRSIIARNNYLS